MTDEEREELRAWIEEQLQIKLTPGCVIRIEPIHDWGVNAVVDADGTLRFPDPPHQVDMSALETLQARLVGFASDQ